MYLVVKSAKPNTVQSPAYIAPFTLISFIIALKPGSNKRQLFSVNEECIGISPGHIPPLDSSPRTLALPT